MMSMAVLEPSLPEMGGDVEPAGSPMIVALVCSAGGLEPVRTILEGLAADFPAAIIVSQHRRPDEKDQLPWILARRCHLQVMPAKDGSFLRPGTVAVVPPGQHSLVTKDGRIVLIPSDEPPPYRPSADLLLASLALVAANRTIAVVLSGMGHDGAMGAMALHRFGGAVIASDETSSTYFEMPKAAIERDGAVDRVLPVSEISEALSGMVEKMGVGHARAGQQTGARKTEAPTVRSVTGVDQKPARAS